MASWSAKYAAIHRSLASAEARSRLSPPWDRAGHGVARGRRGHDAQGRWQEMPRRRGPSRLDRDQHCRRRNPLGDRRAELAPARARSDHKPRGTDHMAYRVRIFLRRPDQNAGRYIGEQYLRDMPRLRGRVAFQLGDTVQAGTVERIVPDSWQ